MTLLLLACSIPTSTQGVVDTCPAYSGLGPAGSWRRWERDDGSWMETLVSARHVHRQGFEDLLVDTVLETDDTRIDLHVIARCDEDGMHHLGAEVTTTDSGDATLNSVALGELVLPHDIHVGDELPDGGEVVGEATSTVGDELLETLEVRYPESAEMCAPYTIWLHAELGLVRSEGDPDCDGTTSITELVGTGE